MIDMNAHSKRLRALIAVAKALSDTNRIRALAALRGGELCVCQIIELLKLAPSTVSKHMTVLRQSGIVESRKDSRWVHYRLSGTGKDDAFAGLIESAFRALRGDAQIAADSAVMKKIRDARMESICGPRRKRPGKQAPGAMRRQGKAGHEQRVRDEFRAVADKEPDVTNRWRKERMQ